jgi:hypothetical protein
VVRICVRLRGILADDVQARQLATVHRVQHLGQVPADVRLERHAPVALEPRAHLGIEKVLEAGQPVRNRAHVAAALHVVLAAQRIAARAPRPDVAREQREIDEREHVVDRRRDAR